MSVSCDGVVVLIRDESGYLLIEQGKDPYRGRWGPVHGAIEEGETQEEAVIRETKEEVRLDVEPDKKITTTPADYKVENLHWWTAENKGGEIRVDKSEISDYGFFDLEKIHDLPLLPQTEKFFEEYEDILKED